MQQAMAPFAAIPLPDEGTISIAIKVAVAAGPVRRFQVGDPQLQYIDVLAGATLQRMASGEKCAAKGEVVLDAATLTGLEPWLSIKEWRSPPDSEYRFAIIAALTGAVDPQPWPALPLASALSEDQLRPWLWPAVYERLQGGQAQFLAELRPVAALFLRFGGLDYDADETAGVKLDAFIQWVQHTVARYEGNLIQLTIGDKGSFLYAAFGAPLAHQDDAARAVAAALDLRRPPASLDFISAIQIGLGRGQMRTGAYGSQTRRTYGVIGDEAILAHRLMLVAGPGQIRCDHSTFQATRNHFFFDTLPSLRVKGKAELVQVYQPLGPVEKKEGPGHTLSPGSQMMVGRQAELERINQATAAALAGESRILLIEGEAGIGKSRLVVELVRLMREQGLSGLLGSGYSLEQKTSYRAWRDIFIAYFYLNGLDDPAERQFRVRLRLQEISSNLTDRLPLLNDVLNLGFPETDFTKSLNPNLRRQSLVALLLTLLRSWTVKRSLVLILEDAHWLDSLSWDLTLQAARALTAAQAPLLLVVVMRPLDEVVLQAGPRRLAELPQTERIRLDKLGPAETLRLAAARLGLAPDGLPQAVAALVSQRSGGNPFFAEELVYALRDQGLIVLEPDPSGSGFYHCVIGGDLEQAAKTLPDTVQDMVLARIDRLPATEQLTLKVASVIGPTFAYPPLFHTLDEHRLMNNLALEAQLKDLAALDLTTLEMPEPELTYAFKHIITREVAYETLLFAQRRQLHQTVAEWYEQAHAANLVPYYSLLAHHWGQAEVSSKAIEYLQKAGDEAARMYANQEAIAYYRRALRLLLARYIKASATMKSQTFDPTSHDLLTNLYLALGQCLELAGQFDDALEQYQAMEQLANQHSDPAMRLKALIRQGRIRCTVNALFDPELGEVLSEQALALAQSLADPAAEAEILWNLLNFYRFTNRLPQAIACGERALTLARDLNLREQMGSICDDLARCYGVSGRFDRSEALFHEASDLWRSLNNLPMLIDSLASTATVHVYTGEYQEALAYSHEALQLGRSIDYVWGQSHSQFMVGYVYWDGGQIDQAIATMSESIRLSEIAGFLPPQVITRANLAAVYGSLGAFRQALDTVDQALLADHSESFRAETLTLQAYLNLLQGNLSQAEQQLADCRANRKAAVFPLISTFCVLTEGELYLQQGDYEQACHLAESVLAELRQSGLWAHIPAALFLLGRALLALGQAEAARSRLLEAKDAADIIGSRRLLWPVLATLSQIEADPVAAQRFHDQARSIIGYILDHISEADLRASFLDLPQVQAVLA
jgi:tetratricopeptide (TPR) repeat protein/class 3 adenylate cyclase